MTAGPLLRVTGLSHRYGKLTALDDASFELWPGEVLGVVGESGSGKSTLLRCLHGALQPTSGLVEYDVRGRGLTALSALSEPERRMLMRTDWGFVHQNPRDGLRLGLSAGGNVGERLLALGARHYGRVRGAAAEWLDRVEIAAERIDDAPTEFSGGMQQRLQIARSLVTEPRLVFMDEPTGGLDVSVQARLLDLLRDLVGRLGVSCVLITHDLGVARLLSHRLIVMQRGRIVEQGLADQVLDDPQHPYAQLLVSSILPA